MAGNTGTQYFPDYDSATNFSYAQRANYQNQGFNVGYSNLTPSNPYTPNQYTTKVDQLSDGSYVVRYGPSTELLGYPVNGTVVEDGSSGESGSSGYADFGSNLEALLQYGPQLAQMQWMEQQKYLPKQTQLALDLAKQYGPQQADYMLGMAQKYQPQYQTLIEQLTSSGRGADINDVLKYAPYLQGIRQASEMPETTALRQQLLGGLNTELSYGTQLTPEQARQTEQAQRTAELARGISGGTGSSAREAVYTALQGQNLLAQRQAKVSSALAQEYQATPDPFQAVLGRPSTAGMAAAQAGTPMSTPTTAGTPINSLTYSAPLLGQTMNYSLGMNQAQMGYNTNANALALQQQQYQNMLAYIPQYMAMLNG